MELGRIQELVDRLPSRTVWAAKKGVGSFITIDVGERHSCLSAEGIRKDVADLHIWVHLCDWQLLRHGEVLLSSESSGTSFAEVLPRVVGETLEQVVADSTPHRLCIVFAGGHRLHLRANLEDYEPEDDMLVLYPYGEEAIGYRADLGFYRDSELAGAS